MSNQQTQVIGAGTLGSSAGRTIALKNEGWLQVYSYQLNYVATATAGSRTPNVVFKDAGANVLWQTQNATAVTASQNVKLLGSGNVPNASFGTNLLHIIPSPFWLPPLSTVTIVDTANIDVSDNIAGGVLTYSCGSM